MNEDYLKELNGNQVREITLKIFDRCKARDYGFEFDPDTFCGCFTWVLIPKVKDRDKLYITFHDYCQSDSHNNSYEDFLKYVEEELLKI